MKRLLTITLVFILQTTAFAGVDFTWGNYLVQGQVADRSYHNLVLHSCFAVITEDKVYHLLSVPDIGMDEFTYFDSFFDGDEFKTATVISSVELSGAIYPMLLVWYLENKGAKVDYIRENKEILVTVTKDSYEIKRNGSSMRMYSRRVE